MNNIITRLHLDDGTTFDHAGMSAEAAKAELAKQRPGEYPHHVKCLRVTFHTEDELGHDDAEKQPF